MEKNNKIILILVFFVLLIITMNEYKNFNLSSKKNSNIINKSYAYDINKQYNKYVVTNKEINLYDSDENIIGKLGEKVELELEDIELDNLNKYYETNIAGELYYINYQDVDKIEELTNIDDRYKKYIPFNENIVTNDTTNFYDENDKLIYSINKSLDLPIIIKEENKYGVEFNNRLLYVNKNDVKETIENHNTDLHNASGVGVLNYHAFYDENIEEEKNNCSTEICHSKAQFKTHLDYLKDNNILTLKMRELEMYIDGKLQLPKSVLITIDDGGREEHGIDMLTEYQMYGTIFLVTSWFEPKDYYKTEYIELHSHSDNLHNQGDCPTGQGGGIQCLSEEIIQKDLKASRDKLGGSTYFCYPFYEYNQYSERMLKEAGFTMAFIGESNYSDNLVHVGSDKFRLRRFVIVTYTTMTDLDNYFGQIK